MTPRAMRRPVSLLAALGLGAALALAACGDDDDDDATGATSGPAIEVTDAWARTSPMAAAAGAAYMTIVNRGDIGDALVAVSVDESVAARAELHETRAAGADDGAGDAAGAMDTGGATSVSGAMPTAPMMEMVPVERIEVPAGGTTTLQPGGLHVMLLEMPAPLEEGSELELTLTFELAGDVVVDAIVGDRAP